MYNESNSIIPSTCKCISIEVLNFVKYLEKKHHTMKLIIVVPEACYINENKTNLTG